MIIEEKNEKEEEKMQTELIKKMTNNLVLPKGYVFSKVGTQICYKNIFGFAGDKIAIIKIDIDKVLRVVFDDTDEYIKLKKCLEDSKTKFRIEVSKYGTYY